MSQATVSNPNKTAWATDMAELLVYRQVVFADRKACKDPQLCPDNDYRGYVSHRWQRLVGAWQRAGLIPPEACLRLTACAPDDEPDAGESPPAPCQHPYCPHCYYSALRGFLEEASWLPAETLGLFIWLDPVPNHILLDVDAIRNALVYRVRSNYERIRRVLPPCPGVATGRVFPRLDDGQLQFRCQLLFMGPQLPHKVIDDIRDYKGLCAADHLRYRPWDSCNEALHHLLYPVNLLRLRPTLAPNIELWSGAPGASASAGARTNRFFEMADLAV